MNRFSLRFIVYCLLFTAFCFSLSAQDDNTERLWYNKPASINRVTITAINGQPFDPEATYAVATNDFCAVGGDTYNVFTHASNSYDTGIQVDDAVMAYVKEVLNGKITEEAYGQPRGSVTVIQ